MPAVFLSCYTYKIVGVLFHTKTVQEAFNELHSSEHGLSSSEVEERVHEYGLNQLKFRSEPLWKKIVAPFSNVFMAVLFVAAAVSLLHHAPVDAGIIAGIMCINAIIYYVQRFSTERVLRALKKHDPERVNVLRNGKRIQLESLELVPGDVITLDEGEKVPADCRVIVGSNLRVDESQLTGESLPVPKSELEVAHDSELYERSNMLYQGSFIVGGQATALVVATGNTTEFGKLAALAVSAEDSSPVQQRIDRLIALLIRVIVAIAAIAFALSLYRGMDIAEATRYVLALSVSAVPESLPVAITVVLVLAMRRMAKKQALVKTPSAIETIGIVTVIASDKTGTLTKNQLTVQHTWSLGSTARMFETLEKATNSRATKTQDPLDTAFEQYLQVQQHATPRAAAAVQTLPFDQPTAMSGNIFHSGAVYELAVKGAPEHIISRSVLTKKEKASIQAQLHHFAGTGFRVIALAHTELNKPIGEFSMLPKKKTMVFDGLVAVADVLRPEAAAAVRRAHQAGIRVYMVTGDHFETAFHIARELGIAEHPSEVFDSREMQGLSDEELARAAEKTRVFARVIPEHKHRLLSILNTHEVTAMTGDGVNDVPALTNAHVGVAMGSGTSIAKEAGDIILLDNNFRSIVEAVHEGRTVYANIKRMVAYLLATNAGEVLVALSALVMGVPIPIVPVQVLWVNLVTDTFMVIPLGLEPGDKRTMQLPPKPANTPLFSKFFLSRIVLTAVTMATLTFVIYLVFLGSHGVDYARTVAFQVLVVAQWASAFNSRSDYETLWTRIRRFNPAFYGGLAVVILLQAVAMSGAMRGFLHLSTISWSDMFAMSAVAFFTMIAVIEFHKWIGREFFHKGAANAQAINAENVLSA